MTLFTRRNFLKTAAAGVALQGLGRVSQAAAGLDPIDAHVHIWTPDTKAYPHAPGLSAEGISPKSFTPAELLAHSQPCGVSRIVLVQMSFYGTDNRYMLDAIRNAPQHFRGIGIIDEAAPDACQTMQKLKTRGVTGFRLYADKKNVDSWQDSKPMEAMWKCAAGTKQAMCLLSNPDALPGIQKLSQRHPETPVVIDHFSRIGMRGSVDAAELDQLCQLAKLANVYVKTSAFYALGAKKAPYTDLGPMVKRLVDTFGPERLMWASDCPFQVEPPHSYADSYALIHDRLDFLSETDKAWLLQKTAEKVFWSPLS